MTINYNIVHLTMTVFKVSFKNKAISYLIHHFNFSKCQPVQPIYFKHSSLVMLFTELLTNIQSCS